MKFAVGKMIHGYILVDLDSESTEVSKYLGGDVYNYKNREFIFGTKYALRSTMSTERECLEKTYIVNEAWVHKSNSDKLIGYKCLLAVKLKSTGNVTWIVRYLTLSEAVTRHKRHPFANAKLREGKFVAKTESFEREYMNSASDNELSNVVKMETIRDNARKGTMNKNLDVLEADGKNKTACSFIRDKINKRSFASGAAALIVGFALATAAFNVVNSNTMLLNRTQTVEAKTSLSSLYDKPTKDTMGAAIRISNADKITIKDDKVFVNNIFCATYDNGVLKSGFGENIESMDDFGNLSGILKSNIGDKLEITTPPFGRSYIKTGDLMIDSMNISYKDETIYSATAKGGVITIEKIDDSKVSMVEATYLISMLRQHDKEVQIRNMEAE